MCIVCVNFIAICSALTIHVSAATPLQNTAASPIVTTMVTTTATMAVPVPTLSTLPQGSYVISTFAGNGTKNVFHTPNTVVVAKDGTMYVASPGNNKILKITPAGDVTTFAGSGTAGTADGKGEAAQFYAPTGITIDPSGNLYVTDKKNNRIRKITPSGDVTTIAGSKVGYADGSGTAALFNGPYNIALDSSGGLYVTDTNNHCIRRITPAGDVSTIAGNGAAGSADGTGKAAQFNLPFGIALDVQGNIYVSDTWNHRIRKITSAGIVTTIAGNVGGFADGVGNSTLFNAPGGVAVDAAGNIYVADISNHRIRKITPDSMVTTIAGSADTGFADDMPAIQGLLNQPFGVACDLSGNIYIADTNNNRIRKLTFVNAPLPSSVNSSISTSSALTSTLGASAANTSAATKSKCVCAKKCIC